MIAIRDIVEYKINKQLKTKKHEKEKKEKTINLYL